MADMHRVSQVQRLDERREIVGISIQIVAVPGLAGAAVAAAVMRDAAVALRGQEEHLVLECVGAERPAMAENDRLPRSPILEIDLRAVVRRDRAHVCVSFRKKLSSSTAYSPFIIWRLRTGSRDGRGPRQPRSVAMNEPTRPWPLVTDAPRVTGFATSRSFRAAVRRRW